MKPRIKTLIVYILIGASVGYLVTTRLTQSRSAVVLSESDSLPAAEEQIADVSKAVYEYFN